MSADLAHIDTWLFDLDNTLYPPEAEFMSLIEGRMTRFVARETGLPPGEAFALQKKYLSEHGTTLAGLMANHGVDPEAFLDEVHDVSMVSLVPDAALRAAIAALPGRRLREPRRRVRRVRDRRGQETDLLRVQPVQLVGQLVHLKVEEGGEAQYYPNALVEDYNPAVQGQSAVHTFSFTSDDVTATPP